MKIIFCAGSNKKLAKIAINNGWEYGIRHDSIAYWHPYFVDINWKQYDWDKYLIRIMELKPTMAMLPDYKEPNKKLLHIRFEQLKSIVDLVAICPKFNGAISDFPKESIIAISVPSKYAGFLPCASKLKGRKVHLLGGTPQKQMELYLQYSGHGADVISIDCNSFMKASHNGTYWESGKWRNRKRTMTNENAFELSVINIKKAWKAIEGKKQLHLRLR